MTEKDFSIISDLKKRLAYAVPLVDFRVFGSRARGDADEYSDMDVFVEVERLDKGLKELIIDIAWRWGSRTSWSFRHSSSVATKLRILRCVHHRSSKSSLWKGSGMTDKNQYS
jgi:predicted nucleotidyltransferase